MAAIALLNTLIDRLNAAGVVTAPATVGVTEPAAPAVNPSIALSLAHIKSPPVGLEQRTQLIEDSALQVNRVFDLSNPVLPEDTSFSLLSGDRLLFTLPHGGLVDSDGQSLPLAAKDLQVDLNGTPVVLVATPPSAGEFSVTPLTGQLLFGAALPGSGSLNARYHISHWEQRIEPLEGELQLSVIGTSSSNIASVSEAVIAAFKSAGESIRGLRQFVLTDIGTIRASTAGTPGSFRRDLAWHVSYEHIIDQPGSSGGIIQRIHLQTRHDETLFETEDIE